MQAARRFYSTSLRSLNIRNDWSVAEIAEIYNRPMMDLVYSAATVHRESFRANEVQKCTLLSIKTGGCTEDCSYCSQSSKSNSGIKPTPLMSVGEVLEAAERAKEAGSTRFCMGSAWREVGGKKTHFNKILEMVSGVNKMGMEVCCTLGMLSADQAKQLKEAGLKAYNHNLDTSPDFYKKIITTRKYEDRLKTLQNVRDAGISVCCGGIIGLGEKPLDRIQLLHVLATLPEHPESVPINALVPISGTPLGGNPATPALDMVRMIATARIVMPKAVVRLSAGRLDYTPAEQALMFFAGANSVFSGDKLLTAANPSVSSDDSMMASLGIVGKPAELPAPPSSP